MTGHDVPATAVERWAGGRVDADHGVIVTPALASDHGLSHNDFVVSHALPGSMRFAYAFSHLSRKLSLGNADAICVEGPFLHAFAFTEPDLSQV